MHLFPTRLLLLLLLRLLQLLLLQLLQLLPLLLSILHLLPHLIGDSNYRRLRTNLLWLLRGTVLSLLSGRGLRKVVGEGGVYIRDPIGHRS